MHNSNVKVISWNKVYGFQKNISAHKAAQLMCSQFKSVSRQFSLQVKKNRTLTQYKKTQNELCVIVQLTLWAPSISIENKTGTAIK